MVSVVDWTISIVEVYLNAMISRMPTSKSIDKHAAMALNMMNIVSFSMIVRRISHAERWVMKDVY